MARATHEEYKSDTGVTKGHPALTDSVVQARLYLENRGHDPDDARQLAEYIQSEKSKEPSGWLERAKRFFSRDESVGEQPGERTEKGQTLSEENLARGMAIHDVSLDLLSTEIDTNREKFATDPAFDFAGVAFVQPESSNEDGSILSAQPVAEPAELRRDADLVDNPLEDMSDEETNEVIERINELESKFGGDDDEQTDGEKAADGDEPDPELGTIERMDALESKFEEQAETHERMVELLERMADAQGVSQQFDTSERDEKASSLDGVAEMLG